jgi:hypothetical protein
MRTLPEYEAWVAAQTDPAVLRRELVERMRVNVGLVAENSDLKRRVAALESPSNPIS